MLRNLVKALVGLTPYRVTRNRPNRFDAMEDFLHYLQKAGCRPSIVIDGGAHVGSFARHAHSSFPEAEIHMVEPQFACAPALRRLAENPQFHFHAVALTSKRKIVHMVCNDAGPDTGAHVAPASEPQANLEVQAESLDNLFLGRIAERDTALLKLDLQGHEMEALRGASAILPRLDVVVTEFSFFAQFDEPTVPEIIRFFDAKGFDLFDIVSVSQRNRDGRARQGDMVFVRRGTPLWIDRSWA